MDREQEGTNKEERIKTGRKNGWIDEWIYGWVDKWKGGKKLEKKRRWLIDWCIAGRKEGKKEEGKEEGIVNVFNLHASCFKSGPLAHQGLLPAPHPVSAPLPQAPMLLSLLSPHPRKVILPSNYSTCKSKRGAHSSEINQYKLKGHPVCFCNNAL